MWHICMFLYACMERGILEAGVSMWCVWPASHGYEKLQENHLRISAQYLSFCVFTYPTHVYSMFQAEKILQA